MNPITLLLLALVGLSATADEVIEDDCVAENGITPICGFLPPEDLDVVPGGKALVVGGFSLDNENGDIRVLRLSDNSIETIYSPDTTATTAPAGADWGDPDCPGSPHGFAAHGIQLTENEHGTYTLLVVNHTSREAVEWFEVIEDSGSFSATWKGCVIVDPELWINDIAMLPDGGFVASHMMPREISRTIFDRQPNDQVETGYVVDWHNQTGWTKITGTEGALPNDVQVSADGKTIYSNHYFSNQVVAIDRASGKRLWTTKLEGAPDNISIGDPSQQFA